MSIQRSDNCTAYRYRFTSRDGELEVPGNECAVSRCRRPRARYPPSKPPTTLPGLPWRKVRNSPSRPRLRCRRGDLHHTNIGAQQIEYSAEKLSNPGMASNCYREGNDPNHITHQAFMCATPCTT